MRIVKSTKFQKWIAKLKDERARGLIASRIYRLSLGHAGDVEPVGEGVSELRIHHGPGYRIYFHQSGSTLIVLLCGGDKGTQPKDIKAAKQLLKDWRAQNG